MLASVLDIKTPTAPPRLTTIFTFAADTTPSPIKLASVPTPSGSLILMTHPSRPTSSLALFHPSYPAVIDSRGLPRSLSTIKEIIMLSPRVAGLLCRISSAEAQEKEKDAVYLVDVAVPAGGVGIAQLLSSAELTARFILSFGAPATEEPETDTVAARDRAFLASFAQALKQPTPAAAVDIFNAYEIAEGDPFALRTRKLLKIREQESEAVKKRSTARLVGEIVKLVLESALGPPVDGEGEEMQPAPKGAYPYVVVRSLIKREWVSDGMWARGGVVRALLVLGDWVRRRLRAFRRGWGTDFGCVGLDHACAPATPRDPVDLARRRRLRRFAPIIYCPTPPDRTGSLPWRPTFRATASTSRLRGLERYERCYACPGGVCRVARGV